MADEDTLKQAQDAAKTGAEVAKQCAEILRHHAAPVHVDVIARLMGMMLGCLPPERQKMFFTATIDLAAMYTADAEKQIAAHKAEKRH